LKTIKYHGQGRERKLDVLAQSDVVITTYNTLATDFTSLNRKSLLHKIHWYRIVLDEGMFNKPHVVLSNRTSNRVIIYPGIWKP
jgi:SNF2 family DNA or RNA helicase